MILMDPENENVLELQLPDLCGDGCATFLPSVM